MVTECRRLREDIDELNIHEVVAVMEETDICFASMKVRPCSFYQTGDYCIIVFA